MRRTYEKEYKILEIGLSVLTTKEAEECWKQFLVAMTANMSVALLHGIAPKSDMERRIETTLKRIRVLKDFKDDE